MRNVIYFNGNNITTPLIVVGLQGHRLRFAGQPPAVSQCGERGGACAARPRNVGPTAAPESLTF
ncbi:hypothetical protein [Streptomyces sp. XY332]|uniref:hypothetical protein n=1 Tax=Streptomyces sp. XY332 TaxID=1415561 RepID=UPI00131AE60F|nr:hypothetical protein [Streptomyces sp. XY332]